MSRCVDIDLNSIKYMWLWRHTR